MTNEDFLNKKFPRHTPVSGFHDQAYDQRDYLLAQVDWAQKYLCDTYLLIDGTVVVNSIDDYDNETSTRGSCLLEAIENAQKEMTDV